MLFITRGYLLSLLAVDLLVPGALKIETISGIFLSFPKDDI
jgi:hypothetical protein